MDHQTESGALARRQKVIFLAAVCIRIASNATLATDYTWTHAGSNNNWDNVANWTPTAPPVTPPAGDTTNIIFAGTSTVATSTSALRQPYAIDSLRFNSDFLPNGTATFNLSSQSALTGGATTANLTLGAGGIVSDVTSFNINITRNTANQGDLILSADQTWALNAAAANTGAITFTVTRPIVGTATVTKTGTGVLVLGQTAANSNWTGGIDLIAGSIRTGGDETSHNGHFGTGSIRSTSANDVTITASTVNNAGGQRLFDNDLVLGGTGRLTFGGSFNLGFTANSEWSLVGQKNLGVSLVTQHDGTIVGDFGLNKLGGGVLVLTGTNTNTGPTNVSEGVLQITNSAALGAGSSSVSVGANGPGTIGAALELSNNITVSGRTLSLAGTGVLTTNAVIGTTANAGALRNRSGNNAWNGAVTVTAPSTYIAVDSGELNLAGGIDGTGSARVAGAGLLRAANIRAAGLQIDDASRVRINSNGTTAGRSTVSTLTLAGGPTAPTATLDITNNALVIDDDTTNTAADVRSLIIAGRAGGAWNGPGITSSTAATSSNGAIGYAASGDLGASVPSIFGTVDSSAVLVRYTLGGDANLTGKVDFADLVSLAQNYNQSGRTWSQGDFDYDGTVGFGDLVVLAQNYNQSVTPAELGALVEAGGASFASDFARLSLAPEPAALLGLCTLVTLVRRVRK